MSLSIAKVFGRSPFVPLQSHMEKVNQCIECIPTIFEAYSQGNTEEVRELAAKISKLEHDADLVKHDIRESLPKGLFMPVDRTAILQILDIQDSIADCAENIGVVLTFKQAKAVEPFKNMLDEFLAKNIDAFQQARLIIGQLDELLETGFGGAEAQKVRQMVSGVEKTEHEADVLQREMLRELLRSEDQLTYGDFFLWTKVIQQVSKIADRAENLAGTIRTTLVTK